MSSDRRESRHLKQNKSNDMILPIYLYGAEVLRNENKEADLNDKEGILKLIEDMKDTLKVADGCGLAAPQVGVNTRIVIVDGRELTETYDYLHDFFRVMINPVVLEESEDTCEYSEGCLSVPGVYAEVRRPSRSRWSTTMRTLRKWSRTLTASDAVWCSMSWRIWKATFL